MIGDETKAHTASASAAIETVHRYHDGTKHDFGRFARSLGYLDWASQPRPFRTFAGTPAFPLSPRLRCLRQDTRLAPRRTGNCFIRQSPSR
jgi:hypothetical protein